MKTFLHFEEKKNINGSTYIYMYIYILTRPHTICLSCDEPTDLFNLLSVNFI